MSSNWRSIVNPVRDGEPVDETSSNRSVSALVERTDWLKERIENLDPSSGRLSFSGAVVNSIVDEGDWVFFDESEDRFDRALAELEWNEALSALVPSRRSLVVGLVTKKLTLTSGIVMIRGTGIVLTELSGISGMADLLQGSGDTFVPGRYYLSSVTPGKMTKTPSGAPLIPLGIFSETFSTIAPDVKEVFEAHLHHRFQLHARPASSQQDGPGWATRDEGDGEIGYVNYRVDDYCLIQLSVRRNATSAPSAITARVDFSRASDDKLRIDIYDSPDRADPDDVSVEKLLTSTVDWPDYGEEIAVGASVGLDLLVSFVRIDREVATRHTANTLAEDIASGDFVLEDGKWSLYLPDDLVGWTNSNPLDPRTPAENSLYRYMVESHHDLYSMFPPVPAEGIVLFENGSIKPAEDYSVSYFGIWWGQGLLDGEDDSTLPWAWDHDESIGGSESGATKDLFLTMSTNPLGPVESVVRCLVSNSSFLKITRLGGTTPASAGKLELTLNLGLAVSGSAPVDSKTTIVGVSPDGNSFKVGHNISQLVAGPNIRLVNVAADDSESEEGPFTGKVKVEAVIPSMSGDAVSLTLFNAKESERNGIIYTEFLKPSAAKTAAVARIKIPNFDPGGGIILLRLFAKFLGDSNVAEDDKKAIFKVDYRIARSGRNISTTLASPQRTEGWLVDFAEGYVGFKILDNELPVYGNTIKKQPNGTVYNLAGSGILAPNDVVSVRLERVVNSSPFQVGDQSSLSNNTLGADDYTGSVGLLDLRWTIELD